MMHGREEIGKAESPEEANFCSFPAPTKNSFAIYSPALAWNEGHIAEGPGTH
jgi:hypothetical protein